MNFLAHLFLSGDDPELLTGNLMGDFVKGRIGERYPEGIRRGIELHRRIDSFAGRNPFFIRSKRRLDPAFGLYKGVLVDLYYDHFLAAEWPEWSSLPFSAFVEGACGIVQQHWDILPQRLQTMLPVLFTQLIPSYVEVAGIERALERMGARIGRVNPLGEGGRELRIHYRALRRDFHDFLPELQEFVGLRWPDQDK